MDISKLMIRDYVRVQSSKEVICVDVVGKNTIRPHNGVSYHPEDLEGIKITDDLLLSLGFKALDDLDFTCFRYWDSDFRYKLDITKFSSYTEYYLHIDNGDCATIGGGFIDYLHELQELVRIITKQEFPIDTNKLNQISND